MKSPPVTPTPKRRAATGGAKEPISVPGSALNMAKVSRQTPSKAALTKARAAKKRVWKAAWNEYVRRSAWAKEASYQQKANTFEIHRSEAIKFYRLKEEEMDTLPHWKFEKKNRRSQHGRSYSHEGVLMLVSRKHATMGGLHEKPLREHELLKQGKELFDKDQLRLLRRTPNRRMEPYLWKTVKTPTNLDPIDWDALPPGCWESPIWEDGRIIGHWLNHEFDPDLGPEDDWMFDEARFRPFGTSERIAFP